MAYQVMQDTEGNYYILDDRSFPEYSLVMWSGTMYEATYCSSDDILELHACPEISPSKLAMEWVRKQCTWEALRTLTPAALAKLPGELPPEKIYAKKEFKLSSAKIVLNVVSLAQVCEDNKWDPPVARRILRKAGLKPAGRWEWDKSDVPKVIQLISQSYR